MIIYRDGEAWVEFEVADPAYRRAEKTISMPLNLYLLAVAESRSLIGLRAKIFEIAGEFARSQAAKARAAAGGSA